MKKTKQVITDLLPREEEEAIALLLLTHVDLDHGADGRLQVVPLRLRGVEDLHGVGASGDGEQRAAVEVHLELSGVQCGAHDDDLAGRKTQETNGYCSVHPPTIFAVSLIPPILPKVQYQVQPSTPIQYLHVTSLFTTQAENVTRIEPSQ